MADLKITKMPLPASEMTRELWIHYRWINVQTLAEAEPMYISAGIRDIAEAKEAAEQFDTWKDQL